MLYTTLTKRAMKIAYKALLLETDFDGLPVFHSVMMTAGAGELKESETCVAFLRPVVTRSLITLDALQDEGFPPDVIAALRCLERGKDETVLAYLRRVRDTTVAKNVLIDEVFDAYAGGRLDSLGYDAAYDMKENLVTARRYLKHNYERFDARWRESFIADDLRHLEELPAVAPLKTAKIKLREVVVYNDFACGFGKSAISKEPTYLDALAGSEILRSDDKLFVAVATANEGGEYKTNTKLYIKTRETVKNTSDPTIDEDDWAVTESARYRRLFCGDSVFLRGRFERDYIEVNDFEYCYYVSLEANPEVIGDCGAHIEIQTIETRSEPNGHRYPGDNPADFPLEPVPYPMTRGIVMENAHVEFRVKSVTLDDNGQFVSAAVETLRLTNGKDKMNEERVEKTLCIGESIALSDVGFNHTDTEPKLFVTKRYVIRMVAGDYTKPEGGV
jgi:hypothetical protein